MAAGSVLTAEAELLPAAVELVGKPRLSRLAVSNTTALVGLTIIAVVLVVAIAAPLLAPSDPNAQDVLHQFQSPSVHHLLGTDQFGRDELSRIIFGARVSVLTSVAVGAAILGIGILVGIVSGLAGGLVDGAIMRAVDVLLAFPSLLLALAVAGTLGPGLLHLALAMTAVWWVDYARIVRGLVLGAKEQPHIESARAIGMTRTRLVFRHVLPSIAPPVVVLATLQTARLLLALAALSFLGLGVAPPTAEWGAMLNDGKNFLDTAPQLMLYPGLAITITALGFNLLGEGLRDVLDPNLK
ncbi:MAG TPA: ABC transporter permease subunit [Solirubrobacteraceae bacterium]|jgi:peptide/nickel transport system permease protein|nr:ABC transporter permease subunit [Solirubrobacteraceae bacterium]